MDVVGQEQDLKRFAINTHKAGVQETDTDVHKLQLKELSTAGFHSSWTAKFASTSLFSLKLERVLFISTACL